MTPAGQKLNKIPSACSISQGFGILESWFVLKLIVYNYKRQLCHNVPVGAKATGQKVASLPRIKESG